MSKPDKTYENHEKIACNAHVGEMYYRALVDAADSYPNGMPRWDELSPHERHRHTLIALQLLESAHKEGLIKFMKSIGIQDNFGDGDNQALLDHFTRDMGR